jgi:predicted nucleic acid-binding Zn ribbon protein
MSTPRGDDDEPVGEPPTELREALDEVLRSLRAPTTRQLGGVFQRWAEAVGPTIAAHATPVSLEQGRLVVEVDEPGWATQLRYLERDVLERLARVAGAGVVRTIELRVRRSSTAPGRRRRGEPPTAS